MKYKHTSIADLDEVKCITDITILKSRMIDSLAIYCEMSQFNIRHSESVFFEEVYTGMELTYSGIVLRDSVQSDIDDEIRWMNTDTQWIQADTPWEQVEPVDPIELRTNMLEYICNRPADAIRSRLEITAEGKHIGFVCAYYLQPPADVGQLAKDGQQLALGIEICEPLYWNKGIGTLSMVAWIRYLLDMGYTNLCLETWSGNYRMMRCAEKLGFSVSARSVRAHKVENQFFDALTYVLDIEQFLSQWEDIK